MEKLLDLLKMTRDHYEKKVFYHYMLWCNLNGYNDLDVQKLLANTALFNWWYREYQKLEADFVEEFESFKDQSDLQDLRSYHTEKVLKVKYLYSKPLMKAARNLKPVILQLN